MEKKPETPVPVQSNGAAGMLTHFAPPERKIGAELEENVKALTGNPLIDGLMFVANGLFAVLNEHRQVLALNESFLKFMGIEDTSKVIGLRPGEYIRCIHSCEMPGGCGTSPYCSTCGAAIAIMAALCGEQPQESTCSITVEKDNKEVELFFQVRCCPITVAANKFILFFLHDISIQKQRDMLDSTFFHDINNLLTGLLGKAELFQLKHTWDPECFGGLQRLIQRMAQELSMQQALNNSMSHVYQPLYCEVSVDSILNDLAETFEGHPLCVGVALDIATIGEPSLLVTDPNLVNRILVNMVTNALEATEPGGTVRVRTEPGGNTITFSVWNKKPIPQEHARKIFTRNFTTKEQLGHGLGTYSMKLFGENVLGGIVNFTTSESEGTTFRLTLLQQ